MEAAGHTVSHLTLPELWDDTRSLYRPTRNRIEKWMDTWKPSVGLASCADDVVRTIAQMCHERGWRVPRDVSLIGTRNEEHFCESPRPALSSVDLGFDRVGYEAARLLETLMNDGKRRRRTAGGPCDAPPEHVPHVILAPVGIVARESTDTYATDAPLVSEAQAFIAKHCHTLIDVSDVAEAVLVSPKTLQNNFAEALQVSVAQEIRRARVERAKRDLAESDITIDEVAERAGFTSNARLCEVFRRDVGMSPREYRKVRRVRRKQ